VGIKLYGSMASNLAIQQSDVDLAVVGLDFKGNRDLLVLEMKKLSDQLELFLKSKIKLTFIPTATIPVIKLTIDLLKIHNQIIKKQGGLSSQSQVVIDPRMRYLGIDITFEDTS
jgi:DNA polymerase sigma